MLLLIWSTLLTTVQVANLVAMSQPVTRIICVKSDHSISTNRYEKIIFQRWIADFKLPQFLIHPVSIKTISV